MDYRRALEPLQEEAWRMSAFVGRDLDIARMAAVRDPALYPNHQASA